MLHHALRSAVISYNDPNFENVTLLLPGNGTNGAQNNTFIDGSTNNFTVTRNGNTTQGTFSPYGTLWSNFFDGTGDFLSVANNTALNLATGDFTIEAFFFPTTFSKEQVIVVKDHTFGSTFWSYKLSALTSGKANISLYDGAGAITPGYDLTSDQNVILNQWNHIAATRSGTTVYIFVNGIGKSGTQSGTQRDGAKAVNIGRIQTGASTFDDISGYISNLRIVKGTAAYTSDFTPTAVPLTAITNTSLLTCQSNRFIDNSSNNFTITRNGNVSVQRFSPFEPAGAYDSAVLGGSGYFDGTGDYLSAASNAAFNPGSGTFTWECWFYPTATWEQSASNSDQLFVVVGVTNGLQVGRPTTSTGNSWGLAAAGTAWRLTTTSLPTLGQWNHMAIARSGTGTNQTAIFLNGSRVAQGTVTQTFAQGALEIARGGAGSESTGFIADMRFVNGSAVYDPASATYTVPTAPLTAVANTSILLNFTNAGVIDSAMMTNFETVGTAQISTTQSKWGGSSVFLNGTGNHLISSVSPRLFSPAAGNFTVEYWCYPTTVGGSTIRRHFSMEEASNALVVREDANIIRPFFRFGSTTAVFLDCSVNFTANVWQHIALVRNGNVFTLYKDGVSVGTITNSGTITLTTANLNINNASESYSGYIDDLRFTLGVARYTAAFTPPLLPFPTR